VRRLAPRPIGKALDRALPDARPAGLLAEVQAAWPAVVGAALAAAASPVSERAGTITVACESAVWAQELDLLGPDLTRRIDEAVSGGRVERLRFIVGSGENRR
jgi:predicted nucleic acid-binding Zn ribbon protein